MVTLQVGQGQVKINENTADYNKEILVHTCSVPLQDTPHLEVGVVCGGGKPNCGEVEYCWQGEALTYLTLLNPPNYRKLGKNTVKREDNGETEGRERRKRSSGKGRRTGWDTEGCKEGRGKGRRTRR